MKETAFISIVTCFNHENIHDAADLIEEIDKYCFKSYLSYEIIIVDYSQEKELSKALSSFCKHLYSPITVLTLSGDQSNENAMQTGIDFSSGDYVFELDVLRKGLVDHFKELYRKMKEGIDYISLVPRKSNSITSSCFYTLFNKITYLNIAIHAEECRLVSRRLLNAASKIRDKSKFRKLTYAFLGYEHDIVSSKIDKANKSIVPLKGRIEMALVLLFSYTNLGINLCLYLSFFFFLLSLSMGCYSIYAYMTLNKVVVGWLTIMSFLSMGFTGIFLVLSLMSKYLTMTLKEIKSIPDVPIKHITKVTR